MSQDRSDMGPLQPHQTAVEIKLSSLAIPVATAFDKEYYETLLNSSQDVWRLESLRWQPPKQSGATPDNEAWICP